MLVKNNMWHVVLHALFDTIKLLPFLFVVFVLISVLESRVSSKKYARLLGGRFAPLVGSAVGVIPQCGFSVMAVKLYKKRCITVGTLLAIFISTSDEAVALLIGAGKWGVFFALAGIKLVVAIAVGYFADFFVKKKDLVWDDERIECSCCAHQNARALHVYFIHPLVHSLKTAGYVLVVNVALGSIIHFVGEDNFGQFMLNTGFFQPFVSALVGLIPNCASSVVIVEVYLSGNLTFSALVAGLIANAGIGLALLIKDKRRWLNTIFIILTLYLVAVFIGETLLLITTLIS